MGIFDKIFGGNKSKQTRLDVATRFRLDRQSMTGTMSTFRVAKEIGSGKLYGLKFLDSEKTEYFKNRFKGLNKPTEGEIALQIKHERIVETYEYGLTTTGQEYILMEYIRGQGLDALIRLGDHAAFKGHRLSLIRQMAESLQAVHDQGFIHRDVCPRNFICDEDISSLKLIDFGLTVPDEPEYRMPGNRTGTPQYMAPEIVRRRETDHRLDIFAFGVTVYRFLTFAHPWGTTDTTGKTALAHDNRDVTQILDHRSDLNTKLAAAIHRCLEVNPDKRPATLKRFLGMIRDVEREAK
jgi:serine/threonine-protein kinase